MNIKVQDVISVDMLKKLMKVVHKYYNDVTYKAFFLTTYFGFLRLASLLPHTVGSFDETRYPIVEDVVLGKPRVHIIITCAKICKNRINIMLYNCQS